LARELDDAGLDFLQFLRVLAIGKGFDRTFDAVFQDTQALIECIE
jgi:hypothetical protein